MSESYINGMMEDLREEWGQVYVHFDDGGCTVGNVPAEGPSDGTRKRASNAGTFTEALETAYTVFVREKTPRGGKERGNGES